MRAGIGFSVIRTVIVFTILFLFFFAQRYWYRRGIALATCLKNHRWRRAAKVALNTAVILIIAIIVDRVLIHFLPRTKAIALIVGLFQLWLFASFFAFLAVKIVAGVEWFWTRIAERRQSEDPLANRGRRAFFKSAATLAGSMPLVAAIYGYTRERLDYRVHRIDIPVANLPPALDGLKIVQLSDIHIGDFMPREEVRRAVALANDLNADIALLTGDFLTGKRDPLEDCIAELSRLRAPLGRWGCNGNHEIYAEAEERVEQLFEQNGMKLLRQTNAQISWRGASFNLIGVDYQRERIGLHAARPMLQSIESLVRRDMPNILMSHNPNSFYRAAELGIELSLAGHTHGGQVQVEIIDHRWSPARFITQFIAGLYRLPMNGGSKSALYVNRGLGTIGFPARIGVDPEISLLTLRRA